MAHFWAQNGEKTPSENEVEKKSEKITIFHPFWVGLAECAALLGRKKEGCDKRLRQRILKIDKKKKDN